MGCRGVGTEEVGNRPITAELLPLYGMELPRSVGPVHIELNIQRQVTKGLYRDRAGYAIKYIKDDVHGPHSFEVIAKFVGFSCRSSWRTDHPPSSASAS